MWHVLGQADSASLLIGYGLSHCFPHLKSAVAAARGSLKQRGEVKKLGEGMGERGVGGHEGGHLVHPATKPIHPGKTIGELDFARIHAGPVFVLVRIQENTFQKLFPHICENL